MRGVFRRPFHRAPRRRVIHGAVAVATVQAPGIYRRHPHYHRLPTHHLRPRTILVGAAAAAANVSTPPIGRPAVQVRPPRSEPRRRKEVVAGPTAAQVSSFPLVRDIQKLRMKILRERLARKPKPLQIPPLPQIGRSSPIVIPQPTPQRSTRAPPRRPSTIVNSVTAAAVPSHLVSRKPSPHRRARVSNPPRTISIITAPAAAVSGPIAAHRPIPRRQARVSRLSRPISIITAPAVQTVNSVFRQLHPTRAHLARPPFQRPLRAVIIIVAPAANNEVVTVGVWDSLITFQPGDCLLITADGTAKDSPTIRVVINLTPQ